MVTLTKNGRAALLILFKDQTSHYNASSMSEVINVSRVGAQKIFKALLKENLIISKRIGKSIIYKPNLKDDYVRQLIAFLLADEANTVRRWKEEFKELYKNGRIIVMFGSAVKDYQKANDIDIMIVLDKHDDSEVNRILKEKKEILPKKLHVLKQTHKDIKDNLKKKDKVMIDIVKSGIVIYGQSSYVEVVKDVTSF